MDRPLNIAVIGSGIAGLSAAWLLSRHHQVTIFEREPRAGGHSNTVDVPCARSQMPSVSTDTGVVPVDTGFIVYNEACYPNLIALFAHLGVPTAPASMSFAVSLDGGGYEYSGSGLAGLFGQPANAFRPSHLRMIADMLHFFKHAPELLEADPTHGPTLGAYLTSNGYSDAFISRHLLPMAAAIWSTPADNVLAFPAAAFVRFFANHGLLDVQQRSSWRTVVGGSRQYVRRLLAGINGPVSLGSPILSVARDSHGAQRGVQITHVEGVQRFDACVIATHADQALQLLSDADTAESRVLGAFRYTSNHAVLHADPAFMPQRRRLWSSWNYMGQNSSHHTALTVTYWMNSLQPLATDQNLFVTLNPAKPVAAGCEIGSYTYRHPMFDHAAMVAQHELWTLQGRRQTWFCGSYFGYGFHEDGLQAGLAAAEDIGGVRRPWTVPDQSSRIHVGGRTSSRAEPVPEAAE